MVIEENLRADAGAQLQQLWANIITYCKRK